MLLSNGYFSYMKDHHAKMIYLDKLCFTGELDPYQTEEKMMFTCGWALLIQMSG